MKPIPDIIALCNETLDDPVKRALKVAIEALNDIQRMPIAIPFNAKDERETAHDALESISNSFP